MTLRELRRGQSARIDHIDTRDPGVVRLMVLGLTEGVEVLHEHSAIGGDPMELAVHGTAVSIRRIQAESFSISPLKPNE